MRICAGQTRPAKGDLAANIDNHKAFIQKAVSHGIDLIFFPELSLTGYEPKLASKLAPAITDEILDCFQNVSEQDNIIICVGLPIVSDSGIMIGMAIFSPDSKRQIYSKQFLHSDELPYFTNGTHQLILTIGDEKIAPAICYESLLLRHSENAHQLGAGIYMASVAKSESGVAKAFTHFPGVAKKYSMSVLMCNCIGLSDNFIGAGCTAVWDNNGSLIEQLDGINEGILIYDTLTKEFHKFT